MTRAVKKPLPVLLVCFAAVWLSGCATLKPENSGPVWRAGEESAHIRHRLSLKIAGREEARFDGLLLKSVDNGRFRVVGLGGFGLTMFDLVIGPDYVNTLSMFPQMAGMQGAAQNIAEAVRRVWSVCLPALERGENAGGPVCRGIRIEGFRPGHEPERIILEGKNYTLDILTLEEK